MKLVIDLTTQRIPESFEYSKYWKPTKCIIIQRAGFTHSLLNLLIKNVKKKKKKLSQFIILQYPIPKLNTVVKKQNHCNNAVNIHSYNVLDIHTTSWTYECLMHVQFTLCFHWVRITPWPHLGMLARFHEVHLAHFYPVLLL